MSKEKSHDLFIKGVCVSLALMLVIVGSNFAICASASSQQLTSLEVKSPAFIEYVSLVNNSYSILFTGLLLDGLNQKPIVNATISIADSRNSTIFGQAKTNESGRFAFSFPLNVANLSIKAAFSGDSQYQGIVSDTVNVITYAPTPSSSTPSPTTSTNTPTPSIPTPTSSTHTPTPTTSTHTPTSSAPTPTPKVPEFPILTILPLFLLLLFAALKFKSRKPASLSR